jgi:hypothetical protein
MLYSSHQCSISCIRIQEVCLQMPQATRTRILQSARPTHRGDLVPRGLYLEAGSENEFLERMRAWPLQDVRHAL